MGGRSSARDIKAAAPLEAGFGVRVEPQECKIQDIGGWRSERQEGVQRDEPVDRRTATMGAAGTETG